LDRAAVSRAIRTLDAHAAEIGVKPRALPSGELSLVFLTDAALARLHADFLDDPSTTDVITFEGDPTLGTAGEICVSVDTAAAYAATHHREFGAELTLYLVHGWLHLCGFDDLAPAKKRAMRRAEARAMALLTRTAALPQFRLK
jgi:probable rRNA maturation factor